MIKYRQTSGVGFNHELFFLNNRSGLLISSEKLKRFKNTFQLNKIPAITGLPVF